MAYKDPNDERAKEAKRKHYYANKEQYLKRNKAKEAAMREWVIERKSRPCMDCGIQYPYYVMDFDHRDPTAKAGSISRTLKRGSWKQLQDEVDKCDVVCSNCHRERTHKSFRIGEAEVAGRSPKPLSTGFDS